MIYYGSVLAARRGLKALAYRIWRVFGIRRCTRMYAIIETGGKQYKVEVGSKIKVEKLNVAAGESITFDKVIAVSKEDQLTVGSPVVEGVTVKADVVEEGKGKKIIVYKYKSKKGYHKKQGHRQPYTQVKITSIEA